MSARVSPPPIAPERLRACREAVRWSVRGMADLLAVDEATVRQWERGRRAPPPAVTAWLERLAAFHDANPPPARPGNRAPTEE